VSGFDLTGKVCIVTGAGREIPHGITESLALHGATAVLTGRTAATLANAASAIGAAASTQVADVARGRAVWSNCVCARPVRHLRPILRYASRYGPR
jgi:NAD(P)-dependent dehydrogenase (short-subunit alcohol dehydrogenase family)